MINKLKLEAERERGQLEENDDIKSKSKTTQACFVRVKPQNINLRLEVNKGMHTPSKLNGKA